MLGEEVLELVDAVLGLVELLLDGLDLVGARRGVGCRLAVELVDTDSATCVLALFGLGDATRDGLRRL
eukprot:7060852-Alexandrium_andersonii.AAC.1